MAQTSNLTIQIPDDRSTSFSHALTEFRRTSQWNTIHLAVAYASVPGLLRFFKDLDAANNLGFKGRYLIGIDDYLTHPGVLETCLNLPNAELRICSAAAIKRRFHPKLYAISMDDGKGSLFCGSNNLTFGGLEKNYEAYSTRKFDSFREIPDFTMPWEQLWGFGQPATSEMIETYKNEYLKRKPKEEDREEGNDEEDTERAGIDADTANGDPSVADVCWIEVGRNTAQGRELEIVGHQALFFGLPPTGGNERTFNFIVSNGSQTSLRMVFRLPTEQTRRNSMWRIQLSREVPEVDQGLRPREADGSLGRSTLVAVFSKTSSPEVFRLSFIEDTSTEYEELLERSEATGAVGSTSARNYGWSAE